MVMHIPPESLKRVEAAIVEAEAHTSGEIVCAISDERHRYVEWVLALAAGAAFLLPVLLTLGGFGPTFWAAVFGQWQSEPLTDRQTIEIFVLMQVAVLLVATLALWWSPFAQRWSPLSLRRERVHEIALKEFLVRGIHLTDQRTGVLLHVSVRDHVAEIVADEGIYSHVSPEHWGETIAALLDGVKRGDPAQGLIDAIALAGEVLASNFPPTADNPDELPNHLLII